jgi:hypothetical protein
MVTGEAQGLGEGEGVGRKMDHGVWCFGYVYMGAIKWEMEGRDGLHWFGGLRLVGMDSIALPSRPRFVFASSPHDFSMVIQTTEHTHDF